MRELDPGALRRSIATVSQDTFLFSASVRDNIAFARPDASDAEVEQAARRAQAHDFVSGAPERLRHGDRRARPDAVGRAAAAHRDRPCARRRSAHPDPRRRDRVGRRDDRGAHPARAARGDAGPHDADHRPPPLDDLARGRDRGARPRPRRRARRRTTRSSAARRCTTRSGATTRSFRRSSTSTATASRRRPREPDRRKHARATVACSGSCGPTAWVPSSASSACSSASARASPARRSPEQAIDQGIVANDRRALALWVVAFVLAALVGWAAMTVQTYSTSWVGRRVLSDLRIDLFAHVQRLELGYFERERAGRIISRLTNDIDALEDLVTDGVTSTLRNSLILVGTAVALVLARLAARARDARRVPADGGGDDRVPCAVVARVSRHARAHGRRHRDARRGPRRRTRRQGVRPRRAQRAAVRRDERALPRGERAHGLAERLVLPVRRAAVGLRNRDRARVRRLPHVRGRDRRRHPRSPSSSTCRTSSTRSSSCRWSTTRTSRRRPR